MNVIVFAYFLNFHFSLLSDKFTGNGLNMPKSAKILMLDTVSIYFLRQNEIYCKIVYYMALFRKTKICLKIQPIFG